MVPVLLKRLGSTMFVNQPMFSKNGHTKLGSKNDLVGWSCPRRVEYPL